MILIFGRTGWIGGKLGDLLKNDSQAFKYANSRLENRESLAKELDEIKPKYVLNAAGVTGRPNVDWCEDHKQEVLRSNVIGCLNLADLCYLRNIHLTIFATGCIFKYDNEHPMGGKTFTEEDDSNFNGSYYSYTKGMVEKMLRAYPNVLTLRVRMPISDDLAPRNFITKITKYAKVVNIPNSMTILHDLLPISIKATQREIKGILNFTNPGAISHNEILALYKEYIDPEFTWVNFTEEEQNKILKAERSNNELSADRMLKLFPGVLHIKDGIKGVFQRMKANLTPQPETKSSEESKAASDGDSVNGKDKEGKQVDSKEDKEEKIVKKKEVESKNNDEASVKESPTKKQRQN